jgi:NadR type nicotinamide-nucleotide adenylyltransferase
MVIRIAITGPESTGKSWLAENLAHAYHTSWVPEYAREYLEKLNRPYTYDDILTIARGQMAAEDSALPTAGRFLFSDTECLVTKIWCDVKYERCHPWIIEQIEQRPYDLYLLCDIDLPWQPDPQREHPHLRQYLFDRYYDELMDRKLPFGVVKGSGEARLECAMEIINHMPGA